MKFRNYLKVLFPVCALSMFMSCQNQEVVLEASQTQRGRDFAEDFHAHFNNIDPNHTWVDGTVGSVMVTTESKANVVIYGLGLNDGTLLRLKSCVVEGTQEVKYDVPLGCKSVVLRAYNSLMNEYKTLDPTNENDEAIMMPGMGTRADNYNNIRDYVANNTPRARQLIPTVWNAYGRIAPWQSTVPNVPGVKAIRNTGYTNQNRNEFYYTKDGVDYKIQAQPIYNTSIPDYWIPKELFADDAAFLSATGFTAEQQDAIIGEFSNVYWQKVKVEHTGGYNNFSFTVTTKDGQETRREYAVNTYKADGTTVLIPEGEYYNFESFGNRAGWWKQTDENDGKYYVINMNLGTEAADRSKSLADAEDYFNMPLSNEVITQIRSILTEAEQKVDNLKPFVNDHGMTTLAPGPVSITYFQTISSTRDYIGYYYTEGDDSPEARKRAAKYLLVDCGTQGNVNRTAGDTFPLTYYGSDGNETPSYEFPKDVHIHFFITHGRDGVLENGAIKHPLSPYSTNAIPNNQWLFLDEVTNEWTLNAYYTAFSEGGEINKAATDRLINHMTVNSEIFAEDGLNGNFTPTISFNYAGYNVIGFEDTPSVQDLDWNDCSFILNGNFDVTNYDEQELSFTMCMEDLGNTNDLDYNDLIMTVTQGHESFTDNSGAMQEYYSAPQVKIVKAGGVLPLKVEFDPTDANYFHLKKTLFEDVHAAFGSQYAVNGERVAINTFDPAILQNGYYEGGSYSDGEIRAVTFNDGAIVNCTKGLAPVVSTWGNEFTSNDIANFSILENIPNFKVYVTYDNGDITCVESRPKDVNPSGIFGPAEQDRDRIPYAFWIPQTDPTNTNSFVFAQERQFINDANSTFSAWVANQNHTGEKWYNWKWGDDNGNHFNEGGNQGGGDTGGGTGGEGGGGTGGGVEETSKTVTLTSDTWTVGGIWNNKTIQIPSSVLLSSATKITVDISFSNAVSTYSGFAFALFDGTTIYQEQSLNVEANGNKQWTFDTTTSNFSNMLTGGFHVVLWNYDITQYISSIKVTSKKE